MKRIRIAKFFDNRCIELYYNKLIVNENNKSNFYLLKNIDELKNIMNTEFDLPNLPIEKAYEILLNERKIDIFKTDTD